jgi:phage gpG-like protein
LRKESSQGQAQVGFVGAMARIMRVHQYGESDTVTRDPSSPRITYPARVVLGINPDDRIRILEQITARIAP